MKGSRIGSMPYFLLLGMWQQQEVELHQAESGALDLYCLVYNTLHQQEVENMSISLFHISGVIYQDCV